MKYVKLFGLMFCLFFAVGCDDELKNIDKSAGSDGSDSTEETDSLEQIDSETGTDARVDSDTDTVPSGYIACGETPLSCADIGGSKARQMYGCCLGNVLWSCPFEDEESLVQYHCNTGSVPKGCGVNEDGELDCVGEPTE